MALHKMKIFNSVASKIVCTVKSSQHFSKRGFCSFYGESTETENVNVFMKQGPQKSMESWEEDGSLRFRFDVPGVPKEKVKLEVVGNTLTFEAEAVEIPCDEGIRAYYTSIELNPIFYNLAKVQVELLHGVLYIDIPFHSSP